MALIAHTALFSVFCGSFLKLPNNWPAPPNTHAQVLAHTLAHELAHALVFHHFPDVDAKSAAYLPDERHGPIFKLLNKRLYGHSIDSFRQVFRGRAGGRGGGSTAGGPLAALDAAAAGDWLGLGGGAGA